MYIISYKMHNVKQKNAQMLCVLHIFSRILSVEIFKFICYTDYVITD